MNWIKRHSRLLLNLLGCLLIGGGAFVAYGWFYKLAPMRHLADPKWYAAHSARARWNEEQNKYRRLSASPDLIFGQSMIGYYGDKHWCLWLIDKMYGNDDFRVCGCTETVLMYMANRHEPSWKDWAKAHGGETQEEWLRDGFAKRGITVHVPPLPEDNVPLLEVLGHKTWNTLFGGPQGTNAPDAFPNYLQYNAFRFLRDSGFNQTAFVISNATAFTSNVVTVGLMQYTKYNAAYPKRDGVGILAFGQATSQEEPSLTTPPIIMPCFQVAAWLLAIVPIATGCLLLFWRRNRVNQVTEGGA